MTKSFKMAKLILRRNFWTHFFITLAILSYGEGNDSVAQTTVPGWRQLAGFKIPLTGLQSIQLPTGEVLIAGGFDAAGLATTTSLLYQPSSGTFKPTANAMAVGRAYFALLSVPVGLTIGSTSRIFAIGGYSGAAGQYTSVSTIEELDYNAAAKTWSWKSVANLSQARGDVAACWDNGNSIIIAGGKFVASGSIASATALRTSERLTLSSLSIAPMGDMAQARSQQFLKAVKNDLGGVDVITASGETPVAPTINEALAGNTWATQGLPRSYHRAAVNVLDQAGIGRVFGGLDDANIPTNKCEWYDVKAGWKALPPLITPTAFAGGTVIEGVNPVALADSALACLLVGGEGQRGELDSTEIYNLPSNSEPAGSWNAFYSLVVAGRDRTVAIAGNNLPVVVGGSRGGVALADAEIFQPFAANDVSFSPEELGRLSDSIPITIRNVWRLPVTITHFTIQPSSEFTLAGDTSKFTIPAGGSNQVFVYFRPSALGRRTGTLTLSIGGVTTDVLLEGTGVASSIALQTAGVDFGGVLIGNRKQLCFNAIKNNGTDTTVIDQVVVTPATDYTLISPIGRIKLRDDSSLVVCMEFHPSIRGPLPIPAKIVLGTRTYVVPVTGKGMRRFITTSESIGCDTVSFVSGASYQKIVTVVNSGDTVVTLNSVGFSAGPLSGYKVIAPIFPTTIAPGASIQVTIQYSPLAEGNSQTLANFINDGDSIVNVDVCFVTRSRSLAISQDSLNFGNVCQGDTLTQDVVIQNPSLFNKVQIASLQLETPNPNLTIVNGLSGTLNPLANARVTVKFAASNAGALSENLVANGSFGQIRIPITANVLPQILYAPQNATAAIGGTVVIPVNIAGNVATTPVSSSILNFDYDRSMLYPTGIEQIPGGPAINGSSSVTYNVANTTRLTVNYSGPLATAGPAFGIRCWVLLGKNDRSSVTLSATPSSDPKTAYCVPESVSQFTIIPDCQGTQALLGSSAKSFVSVSPNPTMSNVEVSGKLSEDGDLTIDLFDESGRVALHSSLGFQRQGGFKRILDLNSIAPGHYFLNTLLNGSLVGTTALLLR